MADQHVFIAYANPVRGREGDYVVWHGTHLKEVVSNIDGFVAGTHYRLNDLQGDEARPAPWEYFIIYDLEGTIDDILAANRRFRESPIYTPHDGVINDEDHVGYFYTPVGEPYCRDGWAGRTAATHIVNARSNPGPLGDDAYNAWYDNHVREVVDSIEGYMGAQRYKLNPSQKSGMKPSVWQYLTIYDIHTADVSAVRGSELAARESGALTPSRGELADDCYGQVFVPISEPFIDPAAAGKGGGKVAGSVR